MMRLLGLRRKTQVSLRVGQWRWLDTNCLSYLARLHLEGRGAVVREWIGDSKVLVTSPNFVELLYADDLLPPLYEILGGGRGYYIPDVSYLWKTDIIRGLGLRRTPGSELVPFQKKDLRRVFTHRGGGIDEAFGARLMFGDRILGRIKSDIGSQQTEHELVAYIYQVLNEWSQRWFDVSVPLKAVRPDRFPGTFTFFYVYYWRYVKKPTAKAERNDIMDIMNTAVAPTMHRYYVERKFSLVLKQVQGKRPPTPLALTKRMKRLGISPRAELEEVECDPDATKPNAPLLEGVEIRRFSEMKQEIVETGHGV